MQNQSKKRRRNHDRFLSSMTFASFPLSCDCDECGLGSSIPPSVTQAVMEHKRSKLLSENLSTLQERTLISRDGGISIWKLALPPGSEPLTEFGNSHRIVLVNLMPRGRTVRSIGEGIIGSGDEKKARRRISWVEMHAYLYRSNGGKAIGWINERQESDNKLHIDDTDADVVLYIIKATKSALLQTADSNDTWASEVRGIFKKCVGENIRDIDTAGKGLNDLDEALPQTDTRTLHKLVVSMTEK